MATTAKKKKKSYTSKIAIGFIILAIVITLNKIYFYPEVSNTRKALSFASGICLIAAFFTIIPYRSIPYFFWDNKDYVPNKSLESLVLKIRFRAILFNNLSILIFLITIVVIITGFYLLANPLINDKSAPSETVSLTIRIGATVLIIFLVNVLFRVFKYLLRVAAFYNGRADGIEINKLFPKTDLETMMKTLSPDSFDISDLPDNSILQDVATKIKGS